MSKLFVTGGAGFIGSNFIRYWLDKHSEDEVVNFDVLTYSGRLENLKDVEGNSRYRFIQGDITNIEEVQGGMKGADVVVHFAAESHVDRSVLGPLAFSQTNVVGTHVLLEMARELGIKRFHHVSTDEVYGSLELDSKDFFHEGRKFDPRSPYSASKAGSDLMVRAYFHTYGMHTTITNTGNNYGPYQYPEKVIPLFITNAIDDLPLPIYGDGKSVREYLHVDDHNRAIEAVLAAGKPGETYCVSTGEEKNTLELAEVILQELGKGASLIQHVADRTGHDRRYAIDWSKIKQDLGWEPLYDFETWMAKTVAWYKENQDWWRKIKEENSYKEYYDKQYGGRIKGKYGV